IVGDFDRSDFQQPRLQIINPNSEKAEIFPRGAFIYDDTLLSDGKTPIMLTVLHIQKTFVENIPFDEQGETQVRVLHTIEEVLKAGGTLVKEGNEEPSWKPQADLLVALEEMELPQKEGTDLTLTAQLTFSAKVCDKNYALATWRLRGM